MQYFNTFCGQKMPLHEGVEVKKDLLHFMQ